MKSHLLLVGNLAGSLKAQTAITEDQPVKAYKRSESTIKAHHSKPNITSRYSQLTTEQDQIQPSIPITGKSVCQHK
jgi:hypothetical protein